MSDKIKRVDLNVMERQEKKTEEGYAYVDYKEIVLPHVVTPMKTVQIGKVTGKLGKIMREAKKNDEIMEYLKYSFGFFTAEENEEKEIEEVLQELQANNAVNLFELIVFLLENIPEETEDIICLLADISHDRVKLLEVEETVKLLLAVIEVNDFKHVVKSVKKLVNSFKAKFLKEAEKQTGEKVDSLRNLT